jgi:hypothetical protein
MSASSDQRDRLALAIARGEFTALTATSGPDRPQVRYLSTEQRDEDGDNVRVTITLEAVVPADAWERVTR